MKLLDVWINCPDADHARRIADRLVEARLAACANIYPPIESVYRWRERIERAREPTSSTRSRPRRGNCTRTRRPRSMPWRPRR
jgi:uncharacterized protein involved in tolerance to divalent cations